MSYGVELTPPFDVLDAMTSRVVQSPTLMARGFRRAMQPVGRRAVGKLSVHAGPVVYADNGHLRWKTPRQKRKVMAMLREAGDLPHQRTYAIADGWEYEVAPLGDGGEFSVSNPVPGVEFVQGDFAQPFHLDTGWPQAAPILSEAQAEAEDAAIEVWYTVTDPFAGVPA